MWHWVALVGSWSIGYSVVGGALGLSGQTSARRAIWGVVLGVGLVVVAAVWLLSLWVGRNEWFIFGLFGGAAMAVAAAVIGRWSGRVWEIAVVLAGVVFAVVIAFSEQTGGEVAKNKVDDVEIEEVKKQDSATDCACGAGVCVGQRGGRYCVRPDGSKKYVAAPGQ